MLQNIILPKYLIYKLLSTTIGLFLISTLLNSCNEVKADKPQDKKEVVVTLQEGQYYQPEKVIGVPYEFDGVVTATEKLYINFKNGGTLEYVANDTELIKEGALLAKVNNTEATSNKQQVSVQLADVNSDLEKLYELQKDSIGPLNDIRKLELKKETLLASKQQASYNVNKAYVTAPFTGYITQQFKENGEEVRPTEPILEYSSIEKKIVFTVPDYIVIQLKDHQEIKITCNSCTKRQKEISGKITKIAFAPEPNGLYRIEASFTDDDQNIKDGFSITVTLFSNTENQYGKLPLRFIDQITETSVVVYIVNKGRAKQLHMPITAEYKDGVIIPSSYLNNTFILPSQLITNGILIQKK